LKLAIPTLMVLTLLGWIYQAKSARYMLIVAPIRKKT
jgi:hypothetical protein